jgi:hypothetical protein
VYGDHTSTKVITKVHESPVSPAPTTPVYGKPQPEADPAPGTPGAPAYGATPQGETIKPAVLGYGSEPAPKDATKDDSKPYDDILSSATSYSISGLIAILALL